MLPRHRGAYRGGYDSRFCMVVTTVRYHTLHSWRFGGAAHSWELNQEGIIARFKERQNICAFQRAIEFFLSLSFSPPSYFRFSYRDLDQISYHKRIVYASLILFQFSPSIQILGILTPSLCRHSHTLRRPPSLNSSASRRPRRTSRSR